MPRLVRAAFRAAARLALLTAAAGCGGSRSARPAPVLAAECGDPIAAHDADTIVVSIPWDGAGAVSAGCAGMALDVRVGYGDQRDQIDAGADVVITRDPATIAYGRGRGEFDAVPLDWDRTYALVVPRRPASWLADTSTAFRRGLARDAVTAEARAAEGPFWWEREPISCAPAGGALPPDYFGSLLAYYDRDRTARELAERLVALATGGGASLRTAPRHAAAEIHSARRDAATVMPLPRVGVEGRACALGLGDATVVPLVDTRATAIVRRGRARLAVESYGGIRLFPPARP